MINNKTFFLIIYSYLHTYITIKWKIQTNCSKLMDTCSWHFWELWLNHWGTHKIISVTTSMVLISSTNKSVVVAIILVLFMQYNCFNLFLLKKNYIRILKSNWSNDYRLKQTEITLSPSGLDLRNFK